MSAEEETKKLAQFILEHMPQEIGNSETAVDVAIRLLAQASRTVELAKSSLNDIYYVEDPVGVAAIALDYLNEIKWKVDPDGTTSS